MISKRIKRLIMSATASMMIFSAIATNVHGKEVNEKYLGRQNSSIVTSKVAPEYIDGEYWDTDFLELEIPIYEEFIKEMGLKLKKEDTAKLKSLYNKVVSLEKKGSFKEVDKVWNNIFQILDKYIDKAQECAGFEECIDCAEENQEIPSFEELLGEDIQKLSKEQIKELKKLYSEIVKYEEENKYTEADSVWQKFLNIVEAAGISIEDSELEEGMSKLIASYEVKNNNIHLKATAGDKNKLSKKNIEKHKVIWERAKQIIPKSYLSRINRYEVVTDGKDNILAYVHSDDNKAWTLSIDIKDAFDENGKLLDKQLNETIIHEFGHILTLNHEQVIPEHKEKRSTYTTDEGTTKKNAYLNLFYKKFWANIYDDYKKLNQDEYNEGDGQASLALYEKYKNQFVSDYASTNPEEDIAESFRVFVTSNKPNGKSIAEKKVLFFYNFSELVKIRKEIRDNMNGLKGEWLKKDSLKNIDKEDAVYGVDQEEYYEGECLTYKEFIQDIEVNIKKEDSKKLESLYNKAVLLEKKEKFEAVDKVWDKIYEILDKYFDVDIVSK